MKKLFILRHAKAIPGDFDKERPLSKAGHKQMHQLCLSHSKLWQTVDLVLCSSSVRTRETLDGVKACLSKTVTINYLDSLYDATAELYLKEIRKVDDYYKAILIVGHNPEITDFLRNVCASQGLSSECTMTKASIAEFTLTKDHWSQAEYSTFNFNQLIKPED
jgi:phosphohistidine phosphatase